MLIQKIKHFNPFVSPWMTIGMSLVLIAVVVFQAVMNYNREKKYMGQLLEEKGSALIRSFEAGSKTGMMGLFGNEAHLQTLLEETASQGDISYIFIVDNTGEILAHNISQKIGTHLTAFDFKKEPTLDKPQWRIVDGEDHVAYFEVYKTFLPVLSNQVPAFRRGMMNRMGNQENMSTWCAPGWMENLPADRILDTKNRPIIFIGMDIKPFEEARAEDMRNSGITVSVIFLLGMAGMVSLFWAQRHARSHRLLQDTRAFASELVTSLPMGIIVVNEKTDITYINEVACSLLKINIHSTKEKNAKDLFPDVLLELHEIVNKGTPVLEKEIFLETKEKKQAPVAVTVTEIIGEQRNFIGFVFMLKDLSDVRDLEIKVQRKERLAAVGTLAAGIAHEVRNPLSSIRGYATFFETLFDDGSENKKAASIMAEEVDRVNRVISELLEFARPVNLKLEKTDIAVFVNNSLRLIKYEAETANVNILKNIDSSLPNVEIDHDRFSQVLLNLYINAIQAMENGGDLTIRVGTQKEDLVFEISDTGQGMSPEDQANIFNPYFTTKKMGTGLGLAIVYKIIESHYGSINIMSSKTKGTTFVVSIPINGRRI
ncbi:MAG: ATP-binding protein [Desulfobacula sp.]|jgi:two-component system sensor histidine kinase HydH|nr:ATP-binding protein [Desulfobacula sp.]